MKRIAMMMAAMMTMACGGTEKQADPLTKQAAVVGGRVFALQGFPVDTLRAADGSPRLLMIGSDKPFNGVKITLSQTTPTSYRGSLEAWYHATSKVGNYFGETNLLHATDGTINLSQDASITWTAPADWVPGYWLAKSSPYCDATCQAVDSTLYWAGITLPYEFMPPGYSPCIDSLNNSGCDPSLPLTWTPPPPPAVNIATVELL